MNILFRPGFCTTVTCLSFCDWKSNLFLAGFDDGAVSLFDMESPHPIATWELKSQNREKVIMLVWSTSKPGVFFSLNDTSVCAWDLTVNGVAPSVVEPLSKKKANVSSFAIRYVYFHSSYLLN
jgi:hypothetical protein